MELKTIVSNIKSMKIQGAEHIALAAIRAIELASRRSKAGSATSFYGELVEAKKRLLSSRPTEPCMANALKFLLHNLNITDARHARSHLDLRIHKAREHFEKAEQTIIEYAARKINAGMTVFTHCHSSTVVEVLLAAKRRGKKFYVNNTETRPMLQGRKTAAELAAAGIKVKHFVDNALRLALKDADIVLIGADAITAEGKVINKIGSELVADIAHNYDTPFYVCSNSWKFDPQTIFGFDESMENRAKGEVWKNAPKNITIMNPAFEIVRPELITGIISEIGTYKPEMFVEEVRHSYPWMFK